MVARPYPVQMLVGLLGTESESFGETLVDIALFHVTAEAFGTRSFGLQHDVINRVYAAVGALRNDAGDQHGTGNILVLLVGDIFLLFVLDGRRKRAIELRTEGFVVIRTVIWKCTRLNSSHLG